jgi:hypothetical protein
VNIGEAIDLNLVLDYLLGLPRDGLPPVDPVAARMAAERLADRASKALSAGISANTITSHWPGPRRKRGKR